jgi:anti-sigma B factor antagonist
MIITEQFEGKIRIISVSGDIDLYSNTNLINFITNEITAEIDSMIISLKEVEYVDSSGIGAMIQILQYARETNIHFTFTEISQPVISLIKLTKLGGFFPIAATMEEAKNLVTNQAKVNYE